MKTICFIAILAVMITAGCTTRVQTEPVDMNAVNDTITQLLDKYLNAWNEKDIEGLTALVSEDGQFFGSDPSELMDKESLVLMYTELFSDTLTDYSYDIDLRKIMIAPDGKLAIVVEYFTLGDWSPMMPLRQISQIVKTGDHWAIDFIAWGFIVKNEDVGKLNKALE